jgi:polyisoprenoid-binding protein YceI
VTIKKLTDINFCITVYGEMTPSARKEQLMPIAAERETRNSTPITPPVLLGSWLVDPQASHARFLAGAFVGLVQTPGRFRSLSGELVVGPAHAVGALAIDASSIDTGNRMRDRHLRSRGFFHVKRYPEVRYEVHSISSHDPGRGRIEGELLVAGTRTPIPLDVTLHAPTEGVIELACRTEVDRVAVGVRGSRGMVPRAVQLEITVTLRRAIA